MKTVAVSHVLLPVVLLVGSAASAQDISFKLHCQNVGITPPEPLGDREGHAISTPQIACRVEGGPVDGGVLVAYTVYEWQGPNTTTGASVGVLRKPGAALMFVNSEAKASLTMSDGKVVGVTGSGHGRYQMASGAASALSGKSYTYTLRSVGFNQVLIEVKVE